MHEHSDKIQPKKLIITIIFAALLLGYAWYSRNNESKNAEPLQTGSTASASAQ